MQPEQDQELHAKLPIDANEKIVGVYKHHWFAYAADWAIGIFVDIVFLAIAVALIVLAGQDSTVAQYRGDILAGVFVLDVIVLAVTFVPVYLRMQEKLVLTEEALLQVLRPTVFASRIDQINLQHIANIAVRQDFLGSIFGYGHVSIETQGEQDDWEFYIVANPRDIVRDITSSKENYEAALNSGRIPTTFSQQPQGPGVNDAQYQQFLQWQQQQAVAQPVATPETDSAVPDQTKP